MGGLILVIFIYLFIKKNITLFLAFFSPWVQRHVRGLEKATNSLQCAHEDRVSDS